MSVWLEEWNRFSEEAIKDMKKFADRTHEEREWMCYVYEKEGVYYLGEVTYGNESRIEVNPAAKHNEDALKNGLTNKMWTIHGHPLKDGKIYTGRQYFSSTDVIDEFIKCRDNNEYIVQFVVYPHQQLDTNTNKRVLHNRVRILVFPNKDVIMEAMKRASPSSDPASITKQSGQNQSVPDGNGGTTLQNEAGVDWFQFQEELGKLGYMGIIDLEGPSAGAESYSAEGELLTRRNLVTIFGIAGIAAVVSGVLKYNSEVSTKLGKLRKRKNVETIDDFSSEDTHWWKL